MDLPGGGGVTAGSAGEGGGATARIGDGSGDGAGLAVVLAIDGPFAAGVISSLVR